MSDSKSMADKQIEAKEKEAAAKKLKHEERMAWLVPATALFVANIVFLSLDVRAFQAMYILTGSYLLAALTVLVSGGLAVYWFDVLYPHARKHNNETQVNLSIVSTALAIGLSGVLAAADYIVGAGTAFDKGWFNILTAVIVILSIYQGIAVGWWWVVDNHIAAEAKIQKAHAENADQNDEIRILTSKLGNMAAFLEKVKELESQHGKEDVAAWAKYFGITLPDGGKQNQQPRPPQQTQQTQVFAAKTEGVKPVNPTNPPTEK